MSNILRPGDRVHVVMRRTFDGEPRRHFAGVVQATSDAIAKIDGWPWLFDPAKNEFVRSKEKRSRLVSLVDAANIIHVLPPELDVEQLRYQAGPGGKYVITDGGSLVMDVNEFGARR